MNCDKCDNKGFKGEDGRCYDCEGTPDCDKCGNNKEYNGKCFKCEFDDPSFKIKSVQDLFIEQCFIHFTADGSCYLHDIQSIGGFDVDVFLNRNYNKNIYLKIQSKNVYKNGDEFCLYHSDSFEIKGDKKLSDFKQTFYAVLMELQQLSFDKVSSKFVKTPPQIAMCEAFPDLFKNSKIVSAVKDCCVCYEKTRQITPCKHILCFPCWSKIIEIPDEDDEDDEEHTRTFRPCPLCRADLDRFYH